MLARGAEETAAPPKDVFNEIDFGSYFQEYLDPGFRTQPEYEDSEKPSFENFLSQPTTLSDHLAWQLGSLSLELSLRNAAEFVIGNLNEDGYLAASEEELAAAFSHVVSIPSEHNGRRTPSAKSSQPQANLPEQKSDQDGLESDPVSGHTFDTVLKKPVRSELFSEDIATRTLDLIQLAVDLVQHLDPAGVAARDLRECLLLQIKAQQQEFGHIYSPNEKIPEDDPHRAFRAEAERKIEERRRVMEVGALIVDRHLPLLLKRDVKELARAGQITQEEAHAGVHFIRTLDPRPGRLYNREQTRLIEPDVVFIKRGGQWVVSMNEEDLPTLRLSRQYRRMLAATDTDKEVKEYVKERFRSAMQLMRNIAQRKSTILRTCDIIVRRQQEFLDRGVEALRPMMIKEVAEELGVHPSTVSRAVANKYAHTPQGVLELRFFFTEGSNGPEGADTPLLVLKRKVKKLIDEEDARRPLTDDQLALMLKGQGINLTRRTVAKYREDLRIPSTHQRRRRDA